MALSTISIFVYFLQNLIIGTATQRIVGTLKGSISARIIVAD